MADYYYSLIARAAARLQTVQERQTLYERGRTVLLAELEAIRPPLSQSIITKELIAFEEAIRRVDAEMAGRAQESR